MMNILFAQTTHERQRDDLHKFHTLPAVWRCEWAFICSERVRSGPSKIYRHRADLPPYMFYLSLHIILYQAGAVSGAVN